MERFRRCSPSSSREKMCDSDSNSADTDLFALHRWRATHRTEGPCQRACCSGKSRCFGPSVPREHTRKSTNSRKTLRSTLPNTRLRLAACRRALPYHPYLGMTAQPWGKAPIPDSREAERGPGNQKHKTAPPKRQLPPSARQPQAHSRACGSTKDFSCFKLWLVS